MTELTVRRGQLVVIWCVARFREGKSLFTVTVTQEVDNDCCSFWWSTVRQSERKFANVIFVVLAIFDSLADRQDGGMIMIHEEQSGCCEINHGDDARSPYYRPSIHRRGRSARQAQG
jgi:hypothetical protein